MTLHKVKGSPPPGKRFYSAPAAISIITGLTYGKAMEAIYDANQLSIARMDSLRTVTASSIARTLWNLHFQMIAKPVAVTVQEAVLARLDDCREPRKPSLAQWLKLRGDLMNETCLVRLKGHWLVVKGRKGADNFKTTPCLSTSAFR